MGRRGRNTHTLVEQSNRDMADLDAWLTGSRDDAGANCGDDNPAHAGHMLTGAMKIWHSLFSSCGMGVWHDSMPQPRLIAQLGGLLLVGHDAREGEPHSGHTHRHTPVGIPHSF